MRVGAALALKRSGGRAAATPTAFTFTATGTARDPSGVLTSYTTSGLWSRVTLEDPALATGLPDTAVAFSASLKDIFGVTRAYVQGDICRVGIWLEDTSLPDDTIAGVCLTDGPISATSLGFGVRLRRVVADAAQRCGYVVNGGSAWSVSEASVSSASARGAFATAGARQQGTIQNVGAAPIDAAGLVIATANTGPTPTSMTGWTSSVKLDTVTIFCGWGTGTGGSAGSVVRFRPVIPFVRLSELPGIGL